MKGKDEMMKRSILGTSLALISLSALAELATVKEGLVYNLDASDLSTITTNELGNVVEWRAKEGMADMVFRGGSIVNDGVEKLYYPQYVTEGNSSYSGMGTIRFGLSQDHTRMWSTWMVGTPKNGMPLTNRTVFLVWNHLGVNNSNAHIWGADGTKLHSVWGVSKRLERVGFLSGTDTIECNEVVKGYKETYFTGCEYPRIFAVSDSDRIYNKASLGRTFYSYSNVEGTTSNHNDGKGTNNYAKGTISQIIVYDRLLTDEEAKYMQSMLKLKWSTNAGKSVLWTGGGDGVNWDDANNWKGGVVPGDGQLAEINGKTVTVRSDVACCNLEVSDANITVLDGVTFSITNTLRATGNTVFTVKKDAELQVNKSETFTSFAGKGASFVLDGGVLSKIGMGIFKIQHDGAITGGKMRVDRGYVDLNGCDVALTDLTGDGTGIVMNSSQEKATVKIIGDTEKTIGVSLLGNVSLEREGGDVKFANMQRYEGDTILNGVKLTAGEGFAPESIKGLVMHVDASRPETLVTNEEGQVLRWQSIGVGDNRAFYFQEPNLDNRFEAQIIPPKYSSTMMYGGKPGVGFSNAAYLYTATNWLKSTVTLTNRTIVAVMGTSSIKTTNRSLALGYRRIVSPWKYYENGGFFGIGVNFDTAYYYDYYVTEQVGTEFEHGDGFSSINGKVVYDPVGGITNAVEVGNAYEQLKISSPGYSFKDQCQLVVMTCPSSWHNQSPGNENSAKLNHKGDIYQVWLGKYEGGGVWAGVFSEILIYDRPLTTSERQALEVHLMDKWGITPAVEMPKMSDPLSPESKISLKADAEIDLNGATQKVDHVKSEGGAIKNGVFAISETLETVVDDEGNIPPLYLSCDFDLTGIDFIMNNARPKKGTILSTTGVLTGTFKSVDVPDSTKVRYRYNVGNVCYIGDGLLLIVR